MINLNVIIFARFRTVGIKLVLVFLKFATSYYHVFNITNIFLPVVNKSILEKKNSKETQHSVNFVETRIFVAFENNYRRKLREAIKI